MPTDKQVRLLFALIKAIAAKSDLLYIQLSAGRTWEGDVTKALSEISVMAREAFEIAEPLHK